MFLDPAPVLAPSIVLQPHSAPYFDYSDSYLNLDALNSSYGWDDFPGITGAGTQGDPYIIRDHTFNFHLHWQDRWLTIQNSAKFVIIKNCSLIYSSGGWSSNGWQAGILILNCSNVLVTDCTFWEVDQAVCFTESAYCRVTNSTFWDSYYQGVMAWYSVAIDIDNNDFYTTGGNEPVELGYSNQSTISRNTMISSEDVLHDDTLYGIVVAGAAYNNRIMNNYIEGYQQGIGLCGGEEKWNNGGHLENWKNYPRYSILASNNIRNCEDSGIWMYWAEHTVIEDNTIGGCGNHGIEVQKCTNSSICDNNITYNAGFGISISDSEWSTVLGNSFAGNALGDYYDSFWVTFTWVLIIIGGLTCSLLMFKKKKARSKKQQRIILDKSPTSTHDGKSI